MIHSWHYVSTQETFLEILKHSLPNLEKKCFLKSFYRFSECSMYEQRHESVVYSFINVHDSKWFNMLVFLFWSVRSQNLNHVLNTCFLFTHFVNTCSLYIIVYDWTTFRICFRVFIQVCIDWYLKLVFQNVFNKFNML